MEKAMSSVLKIDFTTTIIQRMHAIIEDNNQRKKTLEDSDSKKAIEALSKGIWYASHYYLGLKKCHQTPRMEWLVKNGHTFHGYAPAKFFDPIPSNAYPKGRAICQFIIKDGVSPSIAIKQIGCESLALLDCGSTREVAFYQALLEVLGDEKFNKLFERKSHCPLQIGTGQANPISCLFEKVQLRSSQEIQKGDFCHMTTIQEYMAKHPAGNSRGFNVICCDTDAAAKKYLGLGLDPEGVDLEGIEKHLFNAFNATPIEESFLSEEIWNMHFTQYMLRDEKKSRELMASLKERTVNWEEFQKAPIRNRFLNEKMEGRLALQVERPLIHRIQKLAEAPLEEVNRTFASFWKA
jgi:hypothetical protein